jgi:hypothetical protein
MELHATYYWDHFQYVISYVKKHYSKILSEDESTFIQHYQALSMPAQCLYLRLSSRSPTWFRVDKLNYSEIPTIEIACYILESSGFLYFLRPDSEDSLPSLLSIFNRKECSELAITISNEYRIPTSYSKSEAIDYLSQNLPRKKLLEALIACYGPLVRPMQTEIFEFIQFLFFGSTSRDMTDFVVRDLGHRQYMEVAEDELIPFF